MEAITTLVRQSFSSNEPAWLTQRREQLLEAFRTTALEKPDNRTILKKFFTLEQFQLQLQLQPVVPSFSAIPDAVVAMPLADAVRQHPDLVRQHLGSTLEGMHKMEALAASAWNAGSFVFVPDNITATAPVVIETHADSSLIQHSLIIVGNNSKVSIIDKTTGNPAFRAEIVEIIAGEGSEIRYANLQDLGRETVNFSFKRATLDKDASITWMEGNLGGKVTISRMRTLLAGNGSAAKTLGVIVGDKQQHYDINVISHHLGTDTSAHMIAKGVLRDSAKAVFRGLIKIENSAARTSSHQTEDMLLLSGDAEADAIPELKIDNNDVRCSHGATIGELQEDELFYMASRGIHEEDAKRLIVEGFIVSITNELGMEGLNEALIEAVMPRI